MTTPVLNRTDLMSRLTPPEVSGKLSRRRIAAAEAVLVLGGVAIGTAEFVTMGLLPQIAQGIGVSIPTAGHVISAYALGVVVGAPLFAVVGARWPRHRALVVLMALFSVGNLAASLASGYGFLVAARALAGLPHGAFFGFAALVAVDMAPPGRAGRAVGRVMLGIPLANTIGVPAATWLGQAIGWRSAYAMVAGLGVLTLVLITVVVPRSAAENHHGLRAELGDFSRAKVWWTLLTGAIGFGGMFSMYSYIAPTITEVTGLQQGWVPVFLMAFGIGGFTGTMIGGRLADWSVVRTTVIGLVGSAVLLALFTQVARFPVAAFICVFAVNFVISFFVVGLQMQLMRVAGRARSLGAASNHAALNLANALGAWLGGVVIAAGYGFTAASWVGVVLSVLGLAAFALAVRADRRTPEAPATGDRVE